MKLVTLRSRPEFLRVRGGGRCATHAFVLEAKRRYLEPIVPAARPEPQLREARFGFTVTKQLGNAVVRNRIRRRLKAAVSKVAEAAARDHFDYVLIARPAAHDMSFEELKALFARAFERVHETSRTPASRGRRTERKDAPDAERGPDRGTKSGKDANKSRTVTR